MAVFKITILSKESSYVNIKKQIFCVHDKTNS